MKKYYAAMLIGCVGFVVAISGCGYCAQVTNTKTTICKAERTIVSCGPKALAIIAEITPYLIAQDWEAAFIIIARDAPEEATCIKNQIELSLSNTYGAKSTVLISFHALRVVHETHMMGNK